jgi:hypothetical protein
MRRRPVQKKEVTTDMIREKPTVGDCEEKERKTR